MEESTSLIGMVMGIVNNYPAWLNALLSLVGGATAITALTPTKVDNKVVGGELDDIHLAKTVKDNLNRNSNKSTRSKLRKYIRK
jgi:hypothetical protein